MDLHLLTAFVRVVEHGSFTAAARSLSLPKSSVSRAVAKLERALGVRLLHRTTRSVSPTQVGAAYHVRVAGALAGLEEAHAEATRVQATIAGTVRVAAPGDIGQWLLAPVLARFARRHPEVRVEVLLGARVVDLVAEGVDLALRAGPVHSGSLVARRLHEMEGALFASTDYLRRCGRPRTLVDLASHACVVFRAGTAAAGWTLHGPSGVERVDVTPTVLADDYAFVHRVVVAGVGIGLLPTLLAARRGAGAELRRVLPRYRVRGPSLHLVYPARKPPRRVELLRDAIIAGLSSPSRATP